MKELRGKAQLRLTMNRECFLESKITVGGGSLYAETRNRAEEGIERFVIDALVATLFTLVDEEEIAQRALIISLMKARSVEYVAGGATVVEAEPPLDVVMEDDIPF